MHCHCGTNNRAPRWTFTDPCKPEVRPGAREESASPAWLAAPAMNARDTTKVYIWKLDTGCGPILYRKCHSHNTPGKRHNNTWDEPPRGTVLPAPHGKGNNCDKNVKKKSSFNSWRLFDSKLVNYKNAQIMCQFPWWRGHIHRWPSLPCKIIGVARAPCPPPPIPMPMLSNKRDHQYSLIDIERSQIFRRRSR